MTEPATTDLPSPAAALAARFERILRGPMHGLPMLNPALRVQAVGFRPWDRHWLGVLVTPWFMNLVLLPRVRSSWPAIGERASRHYVFPAGVFEFIGHHDAELGDYQACSLFSPMFEFADADGALATAEAALQSLFDAAQRPSMDLPAAPPPPTTAAAPTPALSKRDFLLGHRPRATRGP
ncbi:MAG: [NiFe]-hydrogenase assembly chaperone HybE [Aquabacterium sp.]|nr:[NiFe]-hydrogenase assembly chaperone HybE [Aquabacterium sp.]